MFQPHRHKLSALAKLLPEKYNVRLALLAKDASEEERLRADADVLRINRQIGSAPPEMRAVLLNFNLFNRHALAAQADPTRFDKLKRLDQPAR
jgi:hypothetical protein